jgi:hypothetical protein
VVHEPGRNVANNAGNGEKRRCVEGSVASEDKNHKGLQYSLNIFYIIFIIFTLF